MKRSSILIIPFILSLSCISEREAPTVKPDADMGHVEDLKPSIDARPDAPDLAPDMKIADMGACGDGLDEKPCSNQLGVCAASKARCGELDRGSSSLACTADDYLLHSALYSADKSEDWRCDGLDNDCDGQIDEACCTAAPYPFAHQWPAESLVGDLLPKADGQGYLIAISQYVRNAQNDFVADIKLYVADLQGRPQGVGAPVTPESYAGGSIDLVRVSQDETLLFYSREDGAASGRYVVTLDREGKVKGLPKRIDMTKGRLFATYDPSSEKIFLLFEGSTVDFRVNDWFGCVSAIDALESCISQKFTLLEGMPGEVEPSLAVNASGQWLLAWADKVNSKVVWQSLDPIPVPGAKLDLALKQEASAKLFAAEFNLRDRSIAITVDQDEFSLWYPNHSIVGTSIFRLIPGQAAQSITSPKRNTLILSPKVQRAEDGHYLLAFMASNDSGAGWFGAVSDGGHAQDFELTKNGSISGALAIAAKGALLVSTVSTNENTNIQAQSMLLAQNGAPICAP